MVMDENIMEDLKSKKELIKQILMSINTGQTSIDHLKSADIYYKNHKHKIENDIEKITDKEKLNDRISIFYEKDYEFKKSIIYYLKMLYLVLIFMVVCVVIYKKKHKEKKMYGFLLLLLLIPFFLIL